MYEGIEICFKYYNCKICPFNAKCEKEIDKKQKPIKPTKPKDKKGGEKR